MLGVMLAMLGGVGACSSLEVTVSGTDFEVIEDVIFEEGLEIDLEQMTPQQSEAFREAVRQVLLDDPEIIADALRELERRRSEEALSGLEASISNGEHQMPPTLSMSSLRPQQ